MKRWPVLWAGVIALTLLISATVASAQGVLKIGLLLPMTGPFTSTGRQGGGRREALYAAER